MTLPGQLAFTFDAPPRAQGGQPRADEPAPYKGPCATCGHGHAAHNPEPHRDSLRRGRCCWGLGACRCTVYVRPPDPVDILGPVVELPHPSYVLVDVEAGAEPADYPPCDACGREDEDVWFVWLRCHWAWAGAEGSSCGVTEYQHDLCPRCWTPEAVAPGAPEGTRSGAVREEG